MNGSHEVSQLLTLSHEVSAKMTSLTIETRVALAGLQAGQESLENMTRGIVERLDKLNGRTGKNEMAIAILQDRESQARTDDDARDARETARDTARETTNGKRGIFDKLLELAKIPWMGQAVIVISLALVAATYFAGGFLELMRALIGRFLK